MEVYSFKNWEELKEYSELIFSDADRNLEEAGRELRYFNYICEEVEDGCNILVVRIYGWLC